jgi:hypothetical protein
MEMIKFQSQLALVKFDCIRKTIEPIACLTLTHSQIIYHQTIDCVLN